MSDPAVPDWKQSGDAVTGMRIAYVMSIEDAAELAQVRRQVRSVQVKSMLAAILLTLTAIVLMLPQRRRRIKRP